MQERREYLRADINVFVNEDVEGGLHLVRALDISEAGIRYVKPVGSRQRNRPEVRLEFSLPNDEAPIQTWGLVVYDARDEAKHATSVAFTALTPDQAERIRTYVVRRKRAEMFELLRSDHLGEVLPS